MRLLVVAAFALALGAALALIVSAPQISRVERPPADLETAARTATVTKEVIRERYTFSGKLSAARKPRELPVEGVVTRTPVRDGATPRPGQVLIEVNGRPMIGIDLPFPLWRDLEPGLEGIDVKAVQAALSAIGAYPGPATGHYGEATQAAVRALYQRLGYPPPGNDDPRHGGRKRSEPQGTTLLLSEVAALGGGPWRIDLSGYEVGTNAGGEAGLSLVAAATSLTVGDEGRLAGLLADGAPRSLSLVLGSQTTRVKVVSSRARADGSSIEVQPSSVRLARGIVAGTAVIQSTSGPVSCVPATALRPTADGRTLVRAIIDGSARDIAVRVGLRGDRLVEVHGPQLKPGTTVELL